MKAIAKATEAEISLKHSLELCRLIRGKRLEDAKSIMEGLVNKRIDIDGKYHKNAAKKFLEILNSAEANAKVKELNVDRLYIKTAKADKAFTFRRPKSRWRFRGRRKKSTNITIEMEQR